MITQTDWHGQEAYTLENDALRVVTIPSLGAKIGSIFDKRIGHEWLIQPTVTPVRVPPYAAPYPDYDMNSWDEMFPTIVSCDYPLDGAFKGNHLPDHGEVWAMRWRVENFTADVLTLAVDGKALPYTLRRTVSLQDMSTLKLDYSVTNTGNEQFVYLWSSHPLYAVDEQTEIVLPPTVNEVFNTHDTPPWGAAGNRFAYPHPQTDDGKEWDLRRIGSASLKDCRKFFTPPEVAVGWAGLRQSDSGAWLRMDWEVEKMPYLGVWIDEGIYATVPTAALEPSNAFYDGTVTAVEQGKITTLQPNETHAWTVTVRLSDGSDPII